MTDSSRDFTSPDDADRATISAAPVSRNGAQAVPAVIEPPDTAAATASSQTPPPTAAWRQTFSSLSNHNFLFLWLGMLALMAGMQMQMLARSYLVFDLTGSAALLGIVNAGMAIPILGLSLFGGAFADRIDRKRIIQMGQAGSMVISLAVALIIISGNITWQFLFVASIVQGAMFSFMMPARQAIIPQLVGKEKLSNAMALNAAAMSSMTLIAPGIAGVLYAFAGPHNVYFVISALAGISFIFTSFIPKTGAGKSKGPMTKEIIAGLVYIRNSHMVLVLLVMGLATTLFAMPFRMLLPVFVVDVYHLGPESMGLLTAVMGGGSLVGALFIAAIGNWRRGMLLILGSFASGIALVLLAIFPIYLAAAAIMILLGLGDAGRRSLNQSLIMEEVEDQYRGRVMSVFMMNFGLMPLGVLPTGLLADYVGPQPAIGLLGVLMLITATTVILTQKRLRQLH
ncbi:MAG: MFS transporter [Chloroflexi bacterium]|nr:MFS transporter [Chloroflexota bacterium]